MEVLDSLVQDRTGLINVFFFTHYLEGPVWFTLVKTNLEEVYILSLYSISTCLTDGHKWHYIRWWRKRYHVCCLLYRINREVGGRPEKVSVLSGRDKELNLEGEKVPQTLGGVGEGGGSRKEVRGLLVGRVSVSQSVWSDRGVIVVKVDIQGFC
jgi:hypothetical protein